MSPHSVLLPIRGGRTGAGGKGQKPPITRATRERERDDGDSAELSGRTKALDEAMEIAAGAGRAGYPPKHFDGKAGTTTENGKHAHREYDVRESQSQHRA